MTVVKRKGRIALLSWLFGSISSLSLAFVRPATKSFFIISRIIFQSSSTKTLFFSQTNFYYRNNMIPFERNSFEKQSTKSIEKIQGQLSIKWLKVLKNSKALDFRAKKNLLNLKFYNKIWLDLQIFFTKTVKFRINR